VSTAIEQLVAAGLAESGSRLQEHQAYGASSVAARALSSVGYVGSCLSSPVIRVGRIAGFALPTTHPEAFAPACGGSLDQRCQSVRVEKVHAAQVHDDQCTGVPVEHGVQGVGQPRRGEHVDLPGR
jgi:hypothetical protein